PAMRRNACGYQAHLGEAECAAHLGGRTKMAIVNRIEGAAENAESVIHGRTVSERRANVFIRSMVTRKTLEPALRRGKKFDFLRRRRAAEDCVAVRKA